MEFYFNEVLGIAGVAAVCRGFDAVAFARHASNSIRDRAGGGSVWLLGERRQESCGVSRVESTNTYAADCHHEQWLGAGGVRVE